MSFEHNFMAHQVSARLLADLRGATATWSNGYLTPKATLWQAIADWPKPDVTFQDKTNNASLAFEFKPPNQPKREYITGVGQAVTYLNDFRYAGLILPELANDGYAIAAYIDALLGSFLSGIPIALLSYKDDPAVLTVRRSLTARVDGPAGIPGGGGKKVFWGYWRDISHHDLLVMLSLIDAMAKPSFDVAFGKFWKKFAVSGKAKKWDGGFRKKKALAAPSKKSEQLNAYLAMRHTGLVDNAGRITDDGLELLHVGKIYGAASVAFLDTLTRFVLRNARHLDLILWIEEQQRAISDSKKANANSFYRALDLRLAKEGVISAPSTTAAKAHFLRDEQKLWNKLGLLTPATSNQYFHPGYGLVFNWRKIVTALDGS
jgi:hypothetical protein